MSGFLFQGGAGKALSFVERPLDVDFGLFLELEFVELEFFAVEGLELDEGIVLGVWGFEVEGLLDRERYSSYTADAGTRNTLHSPSYPWRSSSSPLSKLRPFSEAASAPTLVLRSDARSIGVCGFWASERHSLRRCRRRDRDS